MIVKSLKKRKIKKRGKGEEKNNLRIIPISHAHLQTMTKYIVLVKWQKDLPTTVKGVAHTRYINVPTMYTV